MRQLGLATVATLLCACNPSYGEGGFACSNGECPSGYVCVVEGTGKVCRSSGAPATDAPPATDRSRADRPPSGDAARDRTVDGPRSDRGTGDRPAGDRRLDQSIVDGRADVCVGKVACWQDSDGDGFAAGNAAVTFAICTCPAGTTNKDPKLTGNADCQPANKDVYPGQPAYFTVSYCQYCANPPCFCNPSWDYNCDGIIEQQLTAVAGSGKCVKGLKGCVGGGWVGVSTPPDCGQTADFQSCVDIGLQCLSKTGAQQQGCH